MSCIRFGNKFTNTLIRQNSLLIRSNRGMTTNPDWTPVDTPTHTGQEWSKNDYRLSRYVGKTKLVNQHFAIDLVMKEKPIACKERVVYCDGGDEHVGHPRVYINLDEPGNHDCLYCGLRYYYDKHEH